jgi:tripeptide aminopeptidase
MGMPCPNIFTGEMAFHGKHVNMYACRIWKKCGDLVHLIKIWEEKS